MIQLNISAKVRLIASCKAHRSRSPTWWSRSSSNRSPILQTVSFKKRILQFQGKTTIERMHPRHFLMDLDRTKGVVQELFSHPIKDPITLKPKWVNIPTLRMWASNLSIWNRKTSIRMFHPKRNFETAPKVKPKHRPTTTHMEKKLPVPGIRMARWIHPIRCSNSMLETARTIASTSSRWQEWTRRDTRAINWPQTTLKRTSSTILTNSKKLWYSISSTLVTSRTTCRIRSMLRT